MTDQRSIIILIISLVLVTKDVLSLKPKCTVEKILQGSGPFANENVKIGKRVLSDLDISKRLQPTLPDVCDDGTIAEKRCKDLEKSFYRNFRTIDGQCNNLENPLLGSSFSKLSRLLPAEHDKFNKTTYFKKPDNPGMLKLKSNNELIFFNITFATNFYQLEATISF